jgi:glutamate racemase
MKANPIAVFDSGYGGLTVLKEIQAHLPKYDYLYLGDNARAPYGPRSFQEVYEYTLQAVTWLFAQGCPLVILACNTASAKALRNIQQKDLDNIAPGKKILGVIRPTAEVIGNYSSTGHVGVLGTRGTIISGSYQIEANKFFPGLSITQQACPMWVPIVENNEMDNAGADFFVKRDVEKLLQTDNAIDTILLACTHYPLLKDTISRFLPAHVQLVEQGSIVAASLQDYLLRHGEIDDQLTNSGQTAFYTTGDPADFDGPASKFYGNPVKSLHLQL